MTRYSNWFRSWSHDETAPKKVYGLSWVTRSWFLKRDHAVDFSLHFLMLGQMAKIFIAVISNNEQLLWKYPHLSPEVCIFWLWGDLFSWRLRVFYCLLMDRRRCMCMCSWPSAVHVCVCVDDPSAKRNGWVRPSWAVFFPLRKHRGGTREVKSKLLILIISCCWTHAKLITTSSTEWSGDELSSAALKDASAEWRQGQIKFRKEGGWAELTAGTVWWGLGPWWLAGALWCTGWSY